MIDKEPLRKALEHYTQQQSLKLEELRQLEQMIARLKHDIEGETDFVEPFKENAPVSVTQSHTADAYLVPTNGKTRVRPDEFVGASFTTAAKAYLEKVGHAVSLDELLDALNKGGCPVGGVDPKKTLYISLVRDTGNFYLIPGQRGYLGLRKFYPNLKAVEKKPIEVKTHKRRRGRKARKLILAEGKNELPGE